MQHCDLAQEHIIFYALDDLGGARREYVEAHIAACPDCQRRLAEFQKVTQLLRESSVARDDPAHRAAIVNGIGQAARSRRRTHTVVGGSVRKLRFPQHWQPMLIAGLLLALAVAFLAPEASRAGFPLGRVFTFITEPLSGGSSIAPTGREPGETPITDLNPSQYDLEALPFQPALPTKLPLGLMLVHQTRPEPQRLESLYENNEGLKLQLVQMPTEVADVRLSTINSEHVLILDTMVMQHTVPDVDAVAGVYWGRQGFTFLLYVLEAPKEGLATSDARVIVKEVMFAQDASQP